MILFMIAIWPIDIIIDISMTDDIIMTRARQLLHTYYDNNFFWSKTEAR
jgi:hypothetical protein